MYGPGLPEVLCFHVCVEVHGYLTTKRHLVSAICRVYAGMREWYTHGDASAIRAQGESIIFFNTKLSQNFENFQISKHTRGIRRLVISWVTIYYGLLFFTNSHEVASAGSSAFKRV